MLAELGCADPYYLREYVEASTELDPGGPVLLQHERAVMAAIVREIPGTGRADVITPYGYGGPVGEGLAGFYGTYGEWCAERGVISTSSATTRCSGTTGRQAPTSTRRSRTRPSDGRSTATCSQPCTASTGTRYGRR